MVWALPGGQLFSIHSHRRARGASFDETSVGLDHLSFSCANRDKLEQRAASLGELRITDSAIDDQHYESGRAPCGRLTARRPVYAATSAGLPGTGDCG